MSLKLVEKEVMKRDLYYRRFYTGGTMTKHTSSLKMILQGLFYERIFYWLCANKNKGILK